VTFDDISDPLFVGCNVFNVINYLYVLVTGEPCVFSFGIDHDESEIICGEFFADHTHEIAFAASALADNALRSLQGIRVNAERLSDVELH